MRATLVNTICTLALSSILTIGFDAVAQDMNLEAQAGCSAADCMFSGNSQAHDAVSSFQRLPTTNAQEPRMMNVNRFQDNLDFEVNRSMEKQFAPIGELETGRMERGEDGNMHPVFGTAVLVSPCFVLTNAHVALGNDLDPVQGKDYGLKFRAGVGSGTAFLGNTPANVVAWGKRDANGANDWALLKLKSCIGGRADLGFGWYDAPAVNNIDLVGATVGVGGYATDRTRGALSLGMGRVIGADTSNGMMKFCGSMSYGQSGGAVFTVVAGKMIWVGLNSSQISGNGRGATNATCTAANANEFLNVSQVLSQPAIKSLLDADKASVNNLNPISTLLTRPMPSRPVQTAAL